MLKTKLWATISILLAIGIGLVVPRTSSFAQIAQTASVPETVLTALAGYQQWERVNKRLLMVELTVAKLDLTASAFST